MQHAQLNQLYTQAAAVMRCVLMTLQNGILKTKVYGANIPLLLEAVGEYVTPLPSLDDLEVGTSQCVLLAMPTTLSAQSCWHANTSGN